MTGICASLPVTFSAYNRDHNSLVLLAADLFHPFDNLAVEVFLNGKMRSNVVVALAAKSVSRSACQGEEHRILPAYKSPVAADVKV
jgi:hypothetical protein